MTPIQYINKDDVRTVEDWERYFQQQVSRILAEYPDAHPSVVKAAVAQGFGETPFGRSLKTKEAAS